MTNEEEVRALRRPFPPSLVEKKPGQGGKSIDYVAGDRYIERLLDVLGTSWSWKILEWKILESPAMVVVRGRLTVDDEHRDGMDYHPVQSSRATGEISADAVGNALKSADTGALVRAARLLGVGLELWRDGEPATAVAAARAPIKRQMDAIRAIGRVLELDDEGIQVLAEDEGICARGCDLDRDGAARLIATLSHRAMKRESAEERQSMMGRIKKIRQALGWDAKALIAALDGDPRRIPLATLEPMVVSLEEKISEVC